MTNLQKQLLEDMKASTAAKSALRRGERPAENGTPQTVANIASPEIVVQGLKERNRAAETIIEGYAENHALMDVGFGLAGLIPIPGAAVAALGVAILAQGPVIYKPMAADLSAVYRAVPASVDKIVNEGLALNAVVDVGGELLSEFLSEIIGEVISEAWPSSILSFVPFIGGLVAASLDAVIGATLTWRVGTMISIYHQNGGQWINDRKTTYERSKLMVGGFSPRTSNRVKLDSVYTCNPEVKNYQMNTVRALVEMLLSVTKDGNEIRKALNQRNIPPELIDLVLSQFSL